MAPLTLTAYPPGLGPYERWELVANGSGKVIAEGRMPIEPETLRAVCAAYHHGVAEALAAKSVA